MSNHRNLLFEPPLSGIWLLLKDKSIAAAFSGGKDSLALLHYLKLHEHTLNTRIHALHVNHLLRGGESNRDEAFCRRYCEEHGIIFKARTVDVMQSSLVRERGVEYAARKLRYELLLQERESAGYDYILTAHTLDDKVETFFTDLITGASIFTLGGVEELHEWILRPFLAVTSKMVEEFLQAHKLTPIYDSSNSDIRYVRNMVRTYTPFLLTMKATVLRIQEESARLASWLAERTERAVVNAGGDFVELDRNILAEMSEPERGFIIGRWISRLCRGGKVHTDIIIKAIEQRDSFRLSLPMGYLAEFSFNALRIFPAERLNPFSYIKKPGELVVQIPNRKAQITFPATLKERRLIIRSRADGDKFHGKKLKKLFSDAKLPLILRDRAALAAAENNEIIWVEHLEAQSAFEIRLRELP